METGTLLSLLGTALAPVIFLFTFIYLRDRYQREPLRLLIFTFLVGVVIAVPVVFVELYLGRLFGTEYSGDVVTVLLRAFVVVALVEESFKFLGLMLVAYPRDAFDEPYDGIMYAASVSLGFAAIENVLYTFDKGLGVGLLRAFTAVPGHAMMGVVMGYFVGLAKFKQDSGVKGVYMVLGLLFATLIHGAYDFFLMYNEMLVFPLAFLVLIVGIFLGLKAMKIHNRNSPFSNPVENNSTLE
jgi:RsiW-degrading membrane proteinase PrsW (M82 family)